MKLQLGVSYVFGTSPYEVDSTGKAQATAVVVGRDSSVARLAQEPQGIVLVGSAPKFTAIREISREPHEGAAVEPVADEWLAP